MHGTIYEALSKKNYYFDVTKRHFNYIYLLIDLMLLQAFT